MIAVDDRRELREILEQRHLCGNALPSTAFALLDSGTLRLMKLFKCQNCGQILYFENQTCVKCHHRLGYLHEAAVLSALEQQDDDWKSLAAPDERYRFCSNAAFGACNWLIETNASVVYCAACRHNRTIPDLSIPANLAAWQKIEAAKHRLFYSLLKLHLPVGEGAGRGLTFDFLAGSAQPGGPRVMTGHDNGLITLAIEEADDVERERRRSAMHEPYRTLLGHFRHEVGHYFWDRLVRDAGKLETFRALFGDERPDYGQALQTHYKQGPRADWPEHFISAYATAHPWEDFAETWAHYLHIIDTLEMAGAFGVDIRPRIDKDHDLYAKVDFDPYGPVLIVQLIDAWIPLSNALNSLNRTMGLADLYPFILSPHIIRKLGYIHDLVHSKGTAAP